MATRAQSHRRQHGDLVRAAQEIHLIDYVENAGVGLEWYAARPTERL